MSPEDIPLPFGDRVWSMIPFTRRVRLPSNKMEPTTLQIIARWPERGDVRCLARYSDGNIAVIVLRYPRGLRDKATVLRSALLSVYPDERIDMEEDPAA